VTPEVWKKVCLAVDALLLEPASRQRQLEQLRRQDAAVAAEVERLLCLQETPATLDQDGTGDHARPTPPAGDALPADAEPLTVIGPYTLQDQVGKGGMGVVWRARDQQFRRSLAIKILAEGHKDNSSLRRRFVEEAQLMGQLQHPGIPPVHDLGALPDGRPYFAMKLIKGQTLAALLKERLGPEQDRSRLLAIFEQVCQTLAFAHAQRVLHRDLKPANVMVGAFGEVQVMDWGLAKVIDGTADQTAEGAGPASGICTVRSDVPDTATQTGQAMGTPAYMAPEQARGEVSQLDERCDVFGLGAVLCEILTGQPPFAGRNSQEVLRNAQHGNTTVAWTRLQQSGADRELVQLAQRCLAADKEDRPVHAGAVAEALTAYLAQVQERLRRAELERKAAEVRAAEERKRRRVAFRLGSIIALLLVVLGLAGWWVDRSATQARTEREEQQVRGRQAAESLFEQVDQALAGGHAERVEPALQLLRHRLADLDAAGLQQRLNETEKDLAMLRELEQLFYRRWQVVQQLVLEQLLSGQGGGVLTKAPAGPPASNYAPGVSKADLRQDYAAVFARYGLAVGQVPRAEWVERVRQSRIQAALVDALDQWFLVEPDSAGLLAALNVLDAQRAPGRQLVADRAAGKQLGTAPPTMEDNKHQPTTVLCLSELLPDDQAITLLKQAVTRAPEQHRLLTVLVYRLLLSHPNRSAEAVGFARAAYALQPKNAFACLLVAVTLDEDSQDESLHHALQAQDLDPKNAAVHNHLGSTYNNRGDYDRAIPHLKKAIELEPRNATAHNNLGFSYLRKGDLDQGLLCLKKALDLDPKLAVAHCNLGSFYNEQGEYDQAMPHLKTAIATDPKNAPAHNNLGFTYLKKGESDQGLLYLKKAIELDPKYAPAHSNLGSYYNDQGAYDQAIPYLKTAIKFDAKSAPAHNNLGFAYLRKGDLDQGLLYFKKAIELDAKYAPAHNNLGSFYNDQGAYDQAIPHLKTAIETNPKNAPPHNNLGFAYLRKGDVHQGLLYLKKALELDAAYAPTHSNLGSLYNDQGAYDQAIAHLKTAIKLDAKLAVAHSNLGFAYVRKGDWDQGLLHLKKAIELDAKYAPAHSNLGSLYNEQGAYDMAIPHLKTAIELDPKNAPAHSNLGFAYARKGDLDKGLLYLKTAIELDAKYAPAHSNLGSLYNEQGAYDMAVPHLKTAIDLDPKNAPAHNNLGFAYLMKGDRAQGLLYVNKAIELDAKYAPAHANLGSLYNDKGAYDQAIVALKTAIALDAKHAAVHNNLGFACAQKGDFDQALLWLKKAIDLDSKYLPAYHNLSFVCTRKGDWEQAMDYLKKIIDLEPKNSTAHENLGVALFETGQLSQARDVLQRVLNWTPKNSAQFQPRQKYLESVEALLGLETRLEDIVKGDLKPKSFQEGMQLGRLCRVKQYYAAASRLYDAALTLDPAAGKKLTPGDLLFLAQVSLLAAAGKGNDPPAQAERAPYRVKALGWLQQYLQFCRQAQKINPDGLRYPLQQALRQLLQHQDLASVRPPALNDLPAEERQQWQAFWIDVQAMVQQVDAPTENGER
jgi:tetratricopeptide (TPR) repeat protein